jgi:hypothetical protein
LVDVSDYVAFGVETLDTTPKNFVAMPVLQALERIMPVSEPRLNSELIFACLAEDQNLDFVRKACQSQRWSILLSVGHFEGHILEELL